MDQQLGPCGITRIMQPLQPCGQTRRQGPVCQMTPTCTVTTTAAQMPGPGGWSARRLGRVTAGCDFMCHGVKMWPIGRVFKGG